MGGVRNDRRLARRAARGDRDAFATIFGRFQQDLYRYCVAILGDPEDAQDALQNTMVKALVALPGEQREIDLKPWLYRIAHNESIELRRRERLGEPLDEEAAAGGGTLEQSADSRQRLRDLLADVEQLPERQRGALVMRELAGFDFEQIGSALDTSPRAARQVLYEARRGLHEMRDGREMGCGVVTSVLSDQDGRTMRRRDVRAHLRDCADCRRFGEEIYARRESFAAISPLPALAAAAILKGALSGSSGSAVAAAGGAASSGSAGAAAGAAGGAAAKAVSTGILLKSAAGVVAIVAVGAVAADHRHLIDPGGTASDRPAPEPAAAPSDPVAAPTGKDSRAQAAPTARVGRVGAPTGDRRVRPQSQVADGAAPPDVAANQAGVEATTTTAAVAGPPTSSPAIDAAGAESEKSHPAHPVHPEHPATPEPSASTSGAPTSKPGTEAATHPSHPEHPAHPPAKAEEPEPAEVTTEIEDASEGEPGEEAAPVTGPPAEAGKPDTEKRRTGVEPATSSLGSLRSTN
jgi:RNA polymerase sigma factor (sigma-70 family)